jgi:phage shock protein A
MPKKKAAIQMYVSPEEHAAIARKAAQAQLSMSTFSRRVCLGYTIKSKLETQAVLALIRESGNIGRLEGLLKKTLKDVEIIRSKKVNQLIDELIEEKKKLTERIRALDEK